jgi:hypothetical protein
MTGQIALIASLRLADANAIEVPNGADQKFLHFPTTP